MLKEVIMMQIKTMRHDDFIKNISIIQRLLKASYVSSFKMSEDLCNRTVEFKIHELGEYVKSEKTKLVGAFIKDSLVGFIWLSLHHYTFGVLFLLLLQGFAQKHKYRIDIFLLCHILLYMFVL
jgi:hypothetical protein